MAVNKALTDVSEGASERASEKAYMWLVQKEDPADAKGVTIHQGMQLTGGYDGTDLDA